jgi:penicillin-binding protein 2
MRRELTSRGVFARRALLAIGGQMTAFGLLAGRLYHLQVAEGTRYTTLAEENRVSARLIAPPRGRIVDRTGITLAGSKQNWRALLIAEQSGDVSATLDNFSRLIPLGEHERARIEREVQRHRRFIPVIVREFLSWEEMARIEVNAPDLPGITVDVGTTRLYPFSEQFAHVVGYVAPPTENDENSEGDGTGEDPMLALPGVRIGRAGMEKRHDIALRGQAGEVDLEVNAAGRVIRELGRDEGVAGEEVVLTIDAGLQQAVLAHIGDESASAVVMDCQNGEVLAMASNPSFDPSVFDSGVSEAQWVAWTSNRRTPLINKAAAGLYAPGSTFKMAVALAALENGTVAPTDRFTCPGYFDLGDTRFHCWAKHGHGTLDMHGGIKHSCDVFFYHVARRTGIDRIAAMGRRLGMGVELDTDLPGTRSGLMPTRAWRRAHGRAWSLGDTVVSGIGQGYILVTPLALATYVSRIATGRQVVPHLTQSVGGVAQAGADPGDWPVLGVSDRNLRVVRDGMFGVVNEGGGTAPVARIPPSFGTLAGKTGSAQVHRVSREQREHGEFNSAKLPWELRPHALFVAFAPYEAPRYALAVVIEHGNAGAQAAAPVARDIMVEALSRDPARHRGIAGQKLALAADRVP